MSYYQTLKVTTNSSPQDIKKSYYKLAVRFHPDKQRDNIRKKWAEEHFKKIAEAYDVLANPTKRSQYDLQVKMATRKQPSSDIHEDVRKHRYQADRAKREAELKTQRESLRREQLRRETEARESLAKKKAEENRTKREEQIHYEEDAYYRFRSGMDA
jgi:curved DNA-binding protein CbpA